MASLTHVHRRPATAVAALAFTLLAVACGTDVGDAPGRDSSPPTTAAEASTSTTEPTPSTPTQPLDAITLPGPEGGFPPDTVVGCPNGPNFPFSALEEIRPLAGSGLEAVEAAAVEFLTSEEGQFWPQDDWQILHQTEDAALIAHYDAAAGAFSFMDFSSSGSGWSWAGAQSGGGCVLEVPITDGLNRVEWRLDPEAGEPVPEATQVDVVVTEVECVSGQTIGDRLRGPQLVTTPEAVYLSFAAVPPTGEEQTCPGNPEQTVTVELPEPLGDRPILDGRAVGPDLAEWFR